MEWKSMGQGREKTGGPAIMDRIQGDRREYAGDSMMMVSIRSYKEGIPKGAFVCFDYDCRYEFQGFDQMLLMMEDIMDSVSTPRPVYEHRSVYGGRYVFRELKNNHRLPKTGYSPEDIPRLPSGKVSFVLRFRYRQYGSMQGEFLAGDGEESRKVLFRSALELMRLLHEYLDTEMGCC